MKINTEQVRALQEAEAQRSRPQQGAVDFTDLFARQLDAIDNTAQLTAALAAQPVRNVSLTPIAELADGAAQEKTTGEAMQSMDRMFDHIDRYAAGLADRSPASLRDAWSALEDLRSQVADFKTRYPDADQTQPGLAAMLNEIDVLAVTESFKFNRGDYLV